ncbi:MAG: DUF521 domain-containing protein, partial [Actinobacteria bacterium]|nr:DUF521 domain-containing protein [Actinomycetota bacterium]NIS32003.1 DUF521 domain-containing protein [Actinomycetota bacterium]NIT96013.1 DUF521 domain-containing protein [Actinomycetota bacterium]NIU19688.1 DUF521 domain-containing protein [Actinomycetota bacterium]NIU67078.1 DUF521 domain-containing protein [Actinomycetota bacterium]
DELSTRHDGPLAAVSIGTPHFSAAEFAELASLAAGLEIHPEVSFYVNTSREIIAAAAVAGHLDPIRRA